jgi:hypothetical protein
VASLLPRAVATIDRWFVAMLERNALRMEEHALNRLPVVAQSG